MKPASVTEQERETMRSQSFRHLLIGMFMLTLHFGASRTEAAVIDFENLQPMTVQAQYADLGVTFNGPRLFDYSSTGIARSGSKAIELCFAIEFCTAPLVVNFTAG